MTLTVRRLAAILGLSLAFAGCDGGGSSSPGAAGADAASQAALAEVGEMYRLYAREKGKPPRSWKDLEPYFTAFTDGSMALQEGRIAVLWGVEPQPGSADVLAYDATAAEAGGGVLLLDGETVKAMTAEEFQAAPKAPGKVEDVKSKAARKKSA